MSPKKLFFLLFLFPSGISYAQTIQVKKETTKINREIADGYEILVEVPEEELHTSLSKFLKSLGKVRESEGILTVSEPLIYGKKYTRALYSTSRQVGKLSSAWMGIHKKDWGNAANEVEKDLEKLIRDFGVSFYRDKIQKQIDESNRAAQAVERQQQRLLNQNRDLYSRIEDNKREKIQLEKSLESNKLELENLTKRLEKNKKDQDSVSIAGDQIKKVIVIHQERHKKVK